ncbi:hypothetical protein ABT324_01845 [Saccharopolyspora sp. NPDC000359]|uniref:hypothetical protein n=1 Tax=Saccharopolyspora sp. NPDC000359 TaxID=3154251 RepID=UPI00332711E6
MAHDGFRVDLEALRSAEEGVRDAVSELGQMAGWGMAAAGAQGMGLQELTMDSVPHVGHDKLGGALLAFGEAWEWGLRYLVEDGQAAVGALGEARASYHAMDADAVQELQRGVGG